VCSVPISHADQPRQSAARRERLDLLRGANELKHHHDTEQHEHDVEDERAGWTDAPNTSAPMRTAALTTVSTWIQMILRSLLRSLMVQVSLGAGHSCRRSLLAMGPGGGRNVPETGGSIKPKSEPDQAGPGAHGMPLRGS
jgi:hypothetical protein